MEKRNTAAVYIQFAIALFLLGAVIWESTDIFKLFLFHGVYDDINPWALQFYHPHKSELINYLLSCFGLGLAGLAVYCRAWNRGIFAKIADGTRKSFVRLFSALFLLALVNTALKSGFGPEAVRTLAYIAIPLLCSLDYSRLGKALPAAIVLVLAFLCLEPARVVRGPVLLLNEYADLYGETLMDGGYVSNRAFAEYRSRGIPVEDETEFLKKNMLEIHHQTIARGQINHLGHVLNPINEYVAGKPLRDIYIQYGIGNTLLIKRTMDLLGGLSIRNYYKCYAYYIAYYVLFLLMLIYVFRNAVYVLGGLCALAASQFYYGYMSFILGPGLLPTIHFCDVFAIVFLAAYLRGPDKTIPLAAAFLAAAAGALLNRQFGGILATALTMTTLFFLLENTSGRRRYTLSAGVLTAFSLILATSFFITSRSGSAGGFGMFLSGFFSWQPSPSVVFYTLLYISASYIFFALFKDARTHLKYLCAFVFLYAQGLFVYFYWSGLMHHLPMVTPFIGLQLFLTLFLMENEARTGTGVLPKSFLRFKKAALILVMLYVPICAGQFYMGPFSKKAFMENFTSHKLYYWGFNRAGLISTIDPRPLKESLSLIARYSGESENGIYILSRYDNLIPFLAGKYSRFPVFEMAWYLFKTDTGSKVAAGLEQEKPEYIFVDSDMADQKPDLFALAYGRGDSLLRDENESRVGRLMELKKLFRAISPHYALVEKGPLLSVYGLAKSSGQSSVSRPATSKT